ncbi:hypothetical protein [Actinomadura sp. WMMB 499]|uniref:GAP1-N2 domain-containing protein n=1 Tax=Actinomadura sp. WMMB 499 TaxID=1219491 RepID=UPI001247C477|nr:hypothetical protein [Actinomadura sp. WMMB 499]QFG20545.1 hypothetical protein F7P10_04645 [Actinomadura sp. WMMB 499]
MAWQLHYTSVRRGPTGRSGFQVVAETPGLPEGVRAGVLAHLSYRPPPEAPAEPGEADLERFPVSLLYDRVDGRPVLVRCRYLGLDYSHRYGNFFGHAVVAEPAELEGVRPAELWRSPLWEPAGATGGPPDGLDELDDLPPGDSLAPEDLARWLPASGPADPFGTLGVLAGAVGERIAAGDGRVVLVADDADTIARWIALVSYSLPVAAAERLSFVTYSADPQRAAQHLVGTTPGVWADVRHHTSHALAVDLRAGAADAPASRFARAVTGRWRDADFAGLDALAELAQLDGVTPDAAGVLLALCRGEAVTPEEERAAAALLTARRPVLPGWAWDELVPHVPSMSLELAVAVRAGAGAAGRAEVARRCELRVATLALSDPAARAHLPDPPPGEPSPARRVDASRHATGPDTPADTPRPQAGEPEPPATPATTARDTPAPNTTERGATGRNTAARAGHDTAARNTTARDTAARNTAAPDTTAPGTARDTTGTRNTGTPDTTGTPDIPAPGGTREEFGARVPGALAAAPDLGEVAAVAAVAARAGVPVGPDELADAASACVRRGARDLPAALAACPAALRDALLDGAVAGLAGSDGRRLDPGVCDALYEHADRLRDVPHLAVPVLASVGRRTPDRRAAVTAELLHLAGSPGAEDAMPGDGLDAAFGEVWVAPPSVAECTALLDAHGSRLREYAALAELPRRTFGRLAEGAFTDAGVLRLAARVEAVLPGGTAARRDAAAVRAHADAVTADRPGPAAKALRALAGAGAAGRLADAAFGGAARRLCRRPPEFRAALLAALDEHLRARLAQCWTDGLPPRARAGRAPLRGAEIEQRNELVEIVLRLRARDVREPGLEAWARACFGGQAGRWLAGRQLDAHLDRAPELRPVLRDLIAEGR